MAGQAPHIRPAKAGDLDAVRACAEAAYVKYVERIGKEPAPMVADFASQIDQGLLFVADIEGEGVLGYVVCFTRGNHLHLENVAVRPEAQGRGLGRTLIAFAEAQARGQGLKAIELYTNTKMTENLALYPALGYHETGRRHEQCFDRVFFRKSLL